VKPPRPDLVEKAVKPDYALGNHVAPLGLAFSAGAALPEPFTGGAFVGQHGSGTAARNGYNVVHVPFRGRKPSGKPVECSPASSTRYGNALVRPVAVEIDRRGAAVGGGHVATRSGA
jgi:glucose/arabinose dehydrogenase